MRVSFGIQVGVRKHAPVLSRFRDRTATPLAGDANGTSSPWENEICFGASLGNSWAVLSHCSKQVIETKHVRELLLSKCRVSGAFQNVVTSGDPGSYCSGTEAWSALCSEASSNGLIL